MEEIRNKLFSVEYDFLRKDKNLSNIVLLTLGGSRAYGTSNDNSDIDLRGCTLDTKEQILLGNYFTQFEDRKTDTVIYGFNKLVGLLTECNPNTIEMLGCRKDQYFYTSLIGDELLANKKLFLSKKAADSFGGYAGAQLRRLDNKAVRDVGWVEKEKHILNSIVNASKKFSEKFAYFDEDSLNLYIGNSSSDDYDTEILMDISLTGYPLRDYRSMWSEMNNIVKEYNKIGKRNKNAIERDKLGKHMMHLIRLYYMCFDILENEDIVTYREKEMDMLLEIRNGKYLNENKQPIPEFYEWVGELDKRLDYAKRNTSLPDRPYKGRINEFVMSVNERIVRGEV